MNPTQTAVSIQTLSHRYGKNKTLALDNVSLTIPRGVTVGLIGPDGVGKSTLLSLMAGVRVIQQGGVTVLGGDMADKAVRRDLSHRIAYMPQGLGKNLYPTLSVYENVDFHARLYGLDATARQARIARLLAATGLAPFPNRAAGKLSGGMKQKLSLCCALVHSPDLLILDEPTTGVDPLSRRQFWSLVNDLRAEHAGMTVVVATAYIEEAEQFEHLLAMDAGKLLVNRPTREVMADYQTDTLEEAYIQMLPPEKQQGSGRLEITPFVSDPASPPAMEAHGLTKRFGKFTAVDHVSFTIQKGEIFGFLGSNGCGKSTTMKMLTGLLDATEGTAELLGKPINADGMDVKMRVGYMSQAFSLYEELSVRQNLKLHAKLYQMGSRGEAAVNQALQQFDLQEMANTAPASLPLGIRQRLQLAAACLHHPEVLILDEPTSGVDPAARDMFWRTLLKLSREDKITIFVSTHFMNEAERCDRISFMHKGRVLAVGTPDELVAQYHAANLEEVFIHYLEEDEAQEAEAEGGVSEIMSAGSNAAPITDTTATSDAGTFPPQLAREDQGGGVPDTIHVSEAQTATRPPAPSRQREAEQAAETSDSLSSINSAYENVADLANRVIAADKNKDLSENANTRNTHTLKYWLATVFTFANRETKELLRDKIRLFFAVFGPLIMMAAVAWGISFDVQNLKFAVYDRDQSSDSRALTEYFSGSRYFIEQPPLQSAEQIDITLKSSQAVLIIDIPSGFGRDLQLGQKPEVGFYIDGSLPFNAANIQGYVNSLVSAYTRDQIRATGRPISLQAAAGIEVRYMYNQDFNSINAIAPGVIMMVLIMIPAMMAAIGVVREREIGSIANFHASPASTSQYLIGKQLPYIGAGMVNFISLALMMVFWFNVPPKGSLIALLLGTFMVVCASTAVGLLISCFVRSQLAAIFAAAILTMLTTVNYSGFLYPLSTMSGSAYVIGKIYPASWYHNVSMGGFTKSLGFGDLQQEFLVMATFALTCVALACVLLKKQEK